MVRNILKSSGINRDLLCRTRRNKMPTLNAITEQSLESAKAMMHAHEELPQKLWAELVNTAVYILNRT